jgi:micrococcal nuclease
MTRRQLLISTVAIAFLGAIFFFGRAPSGPNVPPTPALTAPVGDVSDGVTVTRVIDGDTIEIAGGDPSTSAQGSPSTSAQGRERVRYIGINTPETVDPRKPVQCFGVEASARNKELVGGKVVRLVRDVSDRDRYGRLLRYVWAGDTFVNLALVREGYAAADTYPPDVAHAEEFRQAEAEARAAGRGLWSGCGAPPPPPPANASTGSSASGCLIKGNIGSTGGKIYHLPGCPYYNATKIDEARGEQWFCSEAEAVAASWRKAANCP